MINLVGLKKTRIDVTTTLYLGRSHPNAVGVSGQNGQYRMMSYTTDTELRCVSVDGGGFRILGNPSHDCLEIQTKQAYALIS